MTAKDVLLAAAEVAANAALVVGPAEPESTGQPEGDNRGPATPPDETLSRRQKIQLVGLVILKRLRFIAILAGVGFFIGYWDTVRNYWDKWTQPQSVAVHALEPGQEFYCPMDPQVVRSTYEPNGDVPKCPICGMPLSIRKKGEAAKLPAGITGRVQLSPERIQLAGIQTVPVEYRPIAKQTKTVGYVAYDESRLSRIVSRVDGYVEKLYVDTTFTMVHKGDPLAEIYSPELYSTARELLVATRTGGVADLAAAARNKLLLLGVSQQEIDGIAASGKPSPRLVIRSPQTGYVVDKKIVHGASVEAKMTLFEVADLSTVWVEADVYEKDIPYLQLGQEVEATVEAYPESHFCRESSLSSIPNWTLPRGPTAFASSWPTLGTSCVPACSPRCESTRRWRASNRTRARLKRVTSFSWCRNGPSSTPARRKWSTRSGSRECSKEWKSNWGLARTDIIRFWRD